MTFPEARAIVADRYPEHLTDSQGRQHRCIPREAILRGDWDGGSLVRKAREGSDGQSAD